jgi:hypothetical protein
MTAIQTVLAMLCMLCGSGAKQHKRAQYILGTVDIYRAPTGNFLQMLCTYLKRAVKCQRLLVNMREKRGRLSVF